MNKSLPESPGELLTVFLHLESELSPQEIVTTSVRHQESVDSRRQSYSKRRGSFAVDSSPFAAIYLTMVVANQKLLLLGHRLHVNF